MGVSNEVQCQPILVSKGDDNNEILVVEIRVKNTPIRLITGYGPQENVTENRVKSFMRPSMNKLLVLSLQGVRY